MILSNMFKPDRSNKEQERPESHARKSAASFKPATKAAFSVQITNARSESSKRKSEKKHLRDEELRRKFSAYHVPTDKYKRYFLICALAVANAIVFFTAAMICREYSPSETLPFVFLSIADLSLIFAFIINWKRIKPEREEYRENMAKAAKSKAGRAAAKQKKTAERNASK